MAYYLSLSSVYTVGDPRRMNCSTPQEMWKIMFKCWELEPTSERIVEDISNWPEVLRKIIANHGCVLYADRLRTGRRYDNMRTGRPLLHKPRASQRKATLKSRVIHPDLEEAREMLMDGRFNTRMQEECMDKELGKIDNLFIPEDSGEDNFEYFAVQYAEIATV